MTKILALSGKKQSGKSTSMNFLHGIQMVSHGIVEGMKIDDKGKLVVPYATESGINWSVFEPTWQDPKFMEYMKTDIYPIIKRYSFAAPLKQFIMDVLGLSYEQCYGTEEQKNSATQYKWEDMPGVIPSLKASEILCDIGGHGENPKQLEDTLPVIVHEPGQMTAREVMQYFGTNIARKMRDNIWSSACIRNIIAEDNQFAVIDDCRFPDEVEAVQAAGGLVVRLNRVGTDDHDQHASETVLDADVYDWDNFDYVLDNQNMTIGEQNGALFQYLVEKKFITIDFEIVEGATT